MRASIHKVRRTAPTPETQGQPLQGPELPGLGEYGGQQPGSQAAEGRQASQQPQQTQGASIIETPVKAGVVHPIGLAGPWDLKGQHRLRAEGRLDPRSGGLGSVPHD